MLAWLGTVFAGHPDAVTSSHMCCMSVSTICRSLGLSTASDAGRDSRRKQDNVHLPGSNSVMRLLCARAQVEKPAEVQEIIGQKRLRDKVSGILERIEKELDSVESKIGEAMHVLDTDNDGMVSYPSELWPW